MVISAASTEYVTLSVTTAPAGADLEGTTPRFAILASGPKRPAPMETDWINGEWASDTDARILVGPDSAMPLEQGIYRVWVNIDPPGQENVVLLAPTPLIVV